MRSEVGWGLRPAAAPAGAAVACAACAAATAVGFEAGASADAASLGVPPTAGAPWACCAGPGKGSRTWSVSVAGPPWKTLAAPSPAVGATSLGMWWEGCG